jgi:hypothetical protein
MNGKPLKSEASALLVAIGHYDNACWDTLDGAPEAARTLAGVLTKGGYTHARPELLDGGDKKSIESALDEWLSTVEKGGTVVLYWSGHGKSDSEGHYLITKNSPPGANVTEQNTVKASALGSALAKSAAEKVLVLLDTCYSGAGAKDIAGMVATVLATRPEQRGRNPAFAVIASVHALKKAQEAVF